MNKLNFQTGNAKLNESIATFSLPSGFTCPMANACFSKANRVTGKITDGPNTIFRCFSASQEALYPSVRKARWFNFELLKKAKTVKAMATLICASLPSNIAKVRVHVAGDFFSEDYFRAWLLVAKANPNIIFYGYTKRADLLVEYLNITHRNFRFIASWGGKKDSLISQYNLKSAKVVYTELEAAELGLEIDHLDNHAYDESTESFALLLHGTQPAGSAAAVAWQKLKIAGKGYSREKRKAAELAARMASASAAIEAAMAGA